MSEINNVCVVGAGTLGARIALQSAIFGFDVTMVDCSQEVLDGAAAKQASEGIDDHIASDLATAGGAAGALVVISSIAPACPRPLPRRGPGRPARRSSRSER